MPTIIDITHTLRPEIATWPGDTPFALAQKLYISEGASVNLTTLTVSAHTGTHMDAPLHFLGDGIAIEQMDLLPYWGLAQVVSVEKKSGALTPADFSHVDLSLAPRLLVHSGASHLPDTTFIENYVHPSPELGQWLGQNGIILYGTDAASMDDMNSKTLDGHKALQANGVSILEGVLLTDVPDGVYELVALPLKIEGGDGSPVRAALKTLD